MGKVDIHKEIARAFIDAILELYDEAEQKTACELLRDGVPANIVGEVVSEAEVREKFRDKDREAEMDSEQILDPMTFVRPLVLREDPKACIPENVKQFLNAPAQMCPPSVTKMMIETNEKLGPKAFARYEEHREACNSIIDTLLKHDAAKGGLFANMVTDVIAPGYSTIIRHPAWLNRAKEKQFVLLADFIKYVRQRN